MMKRLSLLLIPLLWADTALRANTYSVPDDFRIACLDAQTGKILWKSEGKPIPLPERIVVRGGAVIAESGGVKSVLDAENGKRLEQEPAQDATESKPLDLLPRGLKDSQGRVYEYDEGNTRYIEFAREGKLPKVVTPLEEHAFHLHIAGDLALFTFAGGTSLGDLGGGEVYAFDLRKHVLAWEFDASRQGKAVPENAWTGIAVDGSRILVSTNHILFALDLATGKPLWSTALPQQRICDQDCPGAGIARLGDVLLDQCNEHLFAVRAEDGKLLWSVDLGPLCRSRSTPHQGRLYLAVRAGEKATKPLSTNAAPPRQGKALSAVRIAWEKGKPSVTFLSRRDVPAEAVLWWSLHPPPPPAREDPRPRVQVKLLPGSNEFLDYAVTLDVTTVSGEKATYMKINPFICRVAIVQDGREILAVDKHAEKKKE